MITNNLALAASFLLQVVTAAVVAVSSSSSSSSQFNQLSTPQAASQSPSSSNFIAFPFKHSTITNQEGKDATSSSADSVGANYVASTLVISIGLGSPAQLFNLLIDTGSYLFWIRSTACTDVSSCLGKPSFDPSLSSTYSSLSTTTSQQSIVYGDGSNVTCTLAQDTLSLIATSSTTSTTDITSNIQITKQKVCLANHIYTSSASLDGIIGVGPPGNGDLGVADVFATFQQEYPSLQKKMGFWYDVNLTVATGGGGEVSFGGVDNTKYTGAFTSFPITLARQYWSLQLNQVSDAAAGTPVETFGASTVVAIFDSGTTQVLLPSSLASQLNAKMGANYDSNIGAYLLPCSRIATLPAFAFYFAGLGTPLVVSGTQLAVVVSAGSTTCYSIFQSSGQGGSIIFGAWFLRSFYTVFDYQNALVSFAHPTGQLSPNVTIIPDGYNPNGTSSGGNGSSQNWAGLPSFSIFGLGPMYSFILICSSCIVCASLLICCLCRKPHAKRVENANNIRAGRGRVVEPPPYSPYATVYDLDAASSNEIPSSSSSAPGNAYPPSSSLPRIVQSHNPVLLEVLSPSSPSFKDVQRLFQRWGVSGGAAPPIISISSIKISRNDIKERFFWKESELGHLGTSFLFHGTGRTCFIGSTTSSICRDSNCSTCRIIQDGFEVGKHPPPARTRIGGLPRFGQGIYFTTDSGVANNYSLEVPTNDRNIIILAEVLLGNSYSPSRSLWVNEAPLITGFDSIHANTSKIIDLTADEYVVYSVDQILPRFIVEYADPGKSSLPRRELIN